MDIQKLLQESQGDFQKVASLKDLEDVRLKYMGKKGLLTAQMKELGGLDESARKSRAIVLNDFRTVFEKTFGTLKDKFEQEELNVRLEAERCDVTLPALLEQTPTLHPLRQTTEEIYAIFKAMGFELAIGPDIEDDAHNFTALNFPPDHPARQGHDTFYLTAPDGVQKLLRTHTSPVQIRAMRQGNPPLRIIAPGRTYRVDDDATHAPNFHQVEGLVVDKNITMAHMKGTLLTFLKQFFGLKELKIRMRPSFFPFVEPGVEVDMQCTRTKDTLILGEGDDWLEILGAGMVHPNVLTNCNIDPKVYKGFAFGAGIERLTMLKHGIPDLRAFFESDTRFLKHFGTAIF